jgi:drug/metabolite transporter (DMT)-like permease
MKRPSIQLRLAAFLCLFGVFFMIGTVFLTGSRKDLERSIAEDPDVWVLMFLVAVPVSLYVLLTNRYPTWAYRFLPEDERRFAKDRKELILIILLIIMIVGGMLALFLAAEHYSAQ